MLKLYNTLSGKKEDFVINGNQIKMLLCGPTVYDYSHVGHARMLLFYDFVARYFKSKGARVSAIVNITDIDPKLFQKAREMGSSPQEVASKFITDLLDVVSLLYIENFMFACVSDYVKCAENLIVQLVNSDRAYSADGNIYLDSSRVKSLGELAKMTRQDLDHCRLDISPGKKLPPDILLWNASEYFDRMFHSRMLGKGVPWWHIQDTSVAVSNYGGLYDIHGGARELEYPHHESHLAQLKALTSHKKPVSHWTHVGLLQVNGKKMSKSLGNTFSIRDLLKSHTTNAVRLYLYSKHYREDFDFSKEDLDRYENINRMMMSVPIRMNKKRSELDERIFERIEDDFDTPNAMKIMIQAAKSHQLSSAMVSAFGLRY